MPEKRTIRKLSAILSADVKNYSRLMGENELMTVRTLEAYRGIFTETVRNYNGRVVDSPGDNILAEFPSVVDSVEFAIEIQKTLKDKNQELPEDRRMEFRIGINLGDVIVKGERIYGDGVNIAARIEGLAEGGGICISNSVYNQVKNKLKVNYLYFGEHSVKNISEPVQVYKVCLELEKDAISGTEILSLPNKPSIAVLPFVNMSGDSTQEYFTDGITEEIITALSKIQRIFVIASYSTFTYKDKSVPIQKIAGELGVRFVLEGSIRKSGNKVRITAQLVDAENGSLIWSDRYNRDMKDIFALQDEITMRIITSLQVELTDGEQARVSGYATDNLDAYLKVLQAREYFYRMNKQGNVRARELATEAIELDSEYGPPHVIVALSHMMDLWFKFTDSPKDSMILAVEASEKALALDELNPSTYIGLCMLFIMQKKHDEAIAAGTRAVALSPSGSMAHHALGTAFDVAGRQQEALKYFKKAISLNPFPPSIFFRGLGNAYRMLGQYDDAITEYMKALRQSPDDLFTHLGLAITYASLGREEEAQAESVEILRIHPEFSLEYYAKALPYKNQYDIERSIENLRKAGLK